MADPIDRLTHALSKLPGVGQKSAQRLAFHVVRASSEYAQELADAVLAVKQTMQWCECCRAPSPTPLCRRCADPRRQSELVCVVEKPADLHAIENTGVYRGSYHITHGVLSPLDGVSPDDLQLHLLVQRVQAGGVREVILGFSPTVEGEATATYLVHLLRPFGVCLSRLASGVPVGAEVEYIDLPTLALAVESRRPL